MTRARVQLLIMALYLTFGITTIMLPGILLDVLGISSVDRSPVALLMTRAFGAACVGLAIGLFFLIANHSAGRRLMRAYAGLEGAVIAATVLSLGADDIGLRAGLLVAILSGVLGLLNLFGGFLAPEKVEHSVTEGHIR
jgi:hypothetical protein